jgi:hypothetical protein
MAQDRFGGGKFIPLDEIAYEEDEMLDTALTHSLRSQQEYLHRYQGGVSEHTLAAGDGTPGKGEDKPIASLEWTCFKLREIYLPPDTQRLHVDMIFRVWILDGSPSLPVDFRAQCSTSQTQAELAQSPSEYAWRSQRFTLDVSTLREGYHLFSLWVRSRTDAGNKHGPFFVRSPSNVEPHALEDFQFSGVGPANIYKQDGLGVRDTWAQEVLATHQDFDGYSEHLMDLDTRNMVVARTPSILPDYLGSLADLRRISYLQVRSYSLIMEFA